MKPLPSPSPSGQGLREAPDGPPNLLTALPAQFNGPVENAHTATQMFNDTIDPALLCLQESTLNQVSKYYYKTILILSASYPEHR